MMFNVAVRKNTRLSPTGRSGTTKKGCRLHDGLVMAVPVRVRRTGPRTCC
jgi:hypothetical protein